SVKYKQIEICALKGSTVFINSTYTYPAWLEVKEEFWVKEPFNTIQDTPVYCRPTNDSGRVQCYVDKQQHFSLKLINVTKEDEHDYRFRIKTNVINQKWLGDPVKISVTELHVNTPPEVTERETAVLNCTTTCSLSDSPTFIWYKNGRPLSSSTNPLHLQPVSSEDADSYMCAVRGYEHLPSPAQTLTVRYSPKNVSVSISPSGEIVEGSSVTLTCSSDANPPVQNYTWFKEGGTSPVGSGQTYSIISIMAEHTGLYCCVAQNEHGALNGTVTITLSKLYPPKNVLVSIRPSSEIVGDSSVTLTCSSDANPPVQNYAWFKEGGTSSVGSGQTYNITISSNSSGWYYCVAQNEHGMLKSASIDVTLKVLYPPKNVLVSIRPSSEIVGDSSVTLTCSSDANPPVQNYAWFKEGGTSSVGSGQTYNITISSNSNSGEYTCQSSNDHRHGPHSVTLNVLYRPKNVSVSIRPSGEIVEGSPVTLTCSSDANPPVQNYNWFKEKTLLGKESTHIIPNISSEDSGEYKCKSSNEHGSKYSSVILNVMYPPKNVSVSITPSGEILEGSSVTLTCSSDANPPVQNYNWFKEKTLLGKESTHIIPNISFEDSGEYKCKSSNEHGSKYSSVILNVMYPPKNVSVSISPSGEIVEGSSVTLICNSDANPSVQNFNWFKEGRTSPVGSGQNYRVLQSGFYYCAAQNHHGAQNSSTVSVLIKAGSSIILNIAVGVTVCGLSALLVLAFWMRRNRSKRKKYHSASKRRGSGTAPGCRERALSKNADPDSMDDAYTALELKVRPSDNLYDVLATVHPCPDDLNTTTCPVYENITVCNLVL
ncbi:B-cell receptor CD22-like, partial [Electrophorus electricus]|uniref:B-cell receptor CD22-like n=1 Tax=Electrophorus electricus TaxID=8005 RepID=UPI0015D09FC6